MVTVGNGGLQIKGLTTKETEVLIVFWSYSDEGRLTMTVREMFDAHDENQGVDNSDWDWHDYSPTTLGDTLRLLEARALVVSDDKSPASWSMTSLGQAYIDAGGDKDAQRLIVQEGYERYLAALGDTYQHEHARRSLRLLVLSR